MKYARKTRGPRNYATRSVGCGWREKNNGLRFLRNYLSKGVNLGALMKDGVVLWREVAGDQAIPGFDTISCYYVTRVIPVEV